MVDERALLQIRNVAVKWPGRRQDIKAKPPTVLWAVRRLGSGFWVGERWLVLSGFGVLALVNIGGLLALARVGSSAIVEANMEGWNLRMRGSSPAGGL